MDSSSSSISIPLKRSRMPSSGGTRIPSCLVDGCTSDLSKCRDYHRRHKVCELHSKTPRVFIKGQEQRFCQQCSRFHSLVEFDERKRSCRKRLDGHNRRRRKPQPDSLSMNSARLFSSHQCARYLQFGTPQVSSTNVATSTWAEAIKTVNDPILYNSQSSLNFIGRKNPFAGSLSHSYKAGKQFPFLQESTSPTFHGESLSQPNLDATSTIDRHKMFSDGLNQVTGSNCALSLLSSAPAETRDIGLSHMVQPALNQAAQPLISSLNYSGLGMESETVGSILVPDGSSSSVNIQGQNMFQIGAHGSSTSGSHQTLNFSWE